MQSSPKVMRAVSWSFAALAAAAAITAGTAPAKAYDGYNRAILGGFGGGLLGGLAAGAILNAQRPVYAAPVYAAPYPVYVERPAPRHVPTCHFERRRVWLSPHEFTYRRVEVCD